MTMSVFDPTQFLQQTVTESFETRMTPVPEGEYLASIDKIALRTLPNTGQPILDITWNVLDDALKQSLGLPKVTVRQSVFLDLTAEGKLDYGANKNVRLGQIREALNQNTKGQPWGPMMLNGAGPAKVKVVLRPNEKNPEAPFNDIGAIAKAA